MFVPTRNGPENTRRAVKAPDTDNYPLRFNNQMNDFKCCACEFILERHRIHVPAKVCGLLVILETAADDSLANAALVGANKVTPSPVERTKILCRQYIYHYSRKPNMLLKLMTSLVNDLLEF